MTTCYQNDVIKIEYMETKSPVQENDTIMVSFYNDDGSFDSFKVYDYSESRWERFIKVVEETA